MPRRPGDRAGKRPRQERSAATVAAILEASERAFVARGDAATTTEIARIAGVSVGTLYQYFPSKAALLGELIDRHIARVGATIASALASGHGFGGVIEAYLAAEDAARPLLPLMAREAPNVGRAADIEAMEDRMIALVAAGLRRSGPIRGGKDPDVAARVVVLALRAVVQGAAARGPGFLSRDQLARELTDLVTTYLGQ